MAATAPTPTTVKFAQSYNGYDPATIFQVDPTTKTLSPFSSGQALTDAGFQFGQEAAGDPNAFAGFNVGTPIQSKATQLDGVKSDLNSFQNSLFGDQASNQRQASQIDQQISDSVAESDTESKQFAALRDSLNSQDNVSLEDEFKTLSDQQGVSGLNSDLATTKDAERNLEGDYRTVSGDAGIEPESVFQANLAQKQKPLLLKEQTLTDRLSAAQNFITQALSLKQSDQQAASDKISQAAALVGDSVNAIQNRISNLNTLRSGVQAKIDAGQNTATATINTLVQTGALSQLSDSDLHSLELESGMPAGTLASISKAVQPKASIIATETDDNGNLAVVSQNPDGSFSTQVIPGVGKKTQNTGTVAATTKDDVSKVATFFEAKKGADNKVSPQDYQTAQSAWVQDGYKADDFNNFFSNYVNPADPQDYDLNLKAPATKSTGHTILGFHIPF